MASYNLSPIGVGVSFFSGSTPLAGGFLKTYAAGTSTPTATYTTSAGAIANPTSITLDTNGRIAGEMWFPAGQSYKFVLTDSSSNVLQTWDNLAGINDSSVSVTEWLASGATPTYSSGSVFTTAGNTTATFQIGRRVQATVTAGTVYGTITNSVYGVSTTVTLAMDTGMALDSGLSAVNVALLGGTYQSIPTPISYTLTAKALASTTSITAGTTLSVGSTSTFSGVATFTAAPIVPTQAANDNSTKAASTAYVQAQVGYAPAAVGAFRNLKLSTTGTSAPITVTADELVLENAANGYYTARAVSVTPSGAASGANGLDDSVPQACVISIASPGVVTLNNHGFVLNSTVVFTGTVPTGLSAGTTYYVTNPSTNTFNVSATKGGAAINTTAGSSSCTVKSVLTASTWFSVWVIYNGSTVAGLVSSSASNPSLPTGYTYMARVGWIYTDSSGNKYPLSIIQYGRRVQYKLAAGSNVTAMPLAASGSAGSVSVPTWAAVALGNFTPSTAVKVAGVMRTNATCMVAPNNAYGAATSTTNPPVVAWVPGSAVDNTEQFEFILESTSMYWASGGAGSYLFILGWEDA